MDNQLAQLEDPILDRNMNDGYEDMGSAKENQDLSDDPSDDSFWLKRCRSSYQSSQSWFDVAIRRKIEDNMRLFNSTHPRGSRYADESYGQRSTLFRPKTRSATRKLEAACAAAFFATQDALNCSAPNPRDKMQRAGADMQAELLNYRLQHQIPWFITCIGAFQDTLKQGVVISRQEWKWEEVTDVWEEEEVDAMTGKTYGKRRTYETRVVKDHPDIVLRPIENVRFSPAADWRNPLQTSPYLIDMEPFFVGDILRRAKVGPQGPMDVPWRELEISAIRSAMKQNFDPIRQAREGYREDRYEETRQEIQEHDAVWVHHNYFRMDGQDWYFDTLGTELMLSDPVPLEEMTPLRERPYVLGASTIETHKPYPAGAVELMKPLQEEINDITNLRIDNIRHVISPRYFIKRGTSVDIRSLLRNVAGGVTAMEDPKNDVHIRQIQDTTGSSFQEHDRLAVEADELAGTMSQSSIAANHNINERVGNTQMLGESANQLTELTIRTFAETWVEPVLQQIMELERHLETDEMILAIIGQRMDMPAEQVFRMLEMPVRVTVNVGFGATNPQKRIQKVALAFQTLAQINPEWVAGADQMEVTTEIMGAVGFKNAERFFPAIAQTGQEDPQVAQLRQENEKLKGMLQAEAPKWEAQKQIKQMDVQSREKVAMLTLQAKQQLDDKAGQLKFKIEENKFRLSMMDIEIKREQNLFRKQELVQQRIALNHTIAMDERQYELQQREMAMSMNDGATQVDGRPNPQEMRPTQPTKKPEGQQKRIASTPVLNEGDDKSGVVARNNFGAIPHEEG
jgi:hypothetical protein